MPDIASPTAAGLAGSCQVTVRACSGPQSVSAMELSWSVIGSPGWSGGPGAAEERLRTVR